MDICEDETNTMTIYTNSDANDDAAQNSESDFQKKLQLRMKERKGTVVVVSFNLSYKAQHLFQHWRCMCVFVVTLYILLMPIPFRPADAA